MSAWRKHDRGRSSVAKIKMAMAKTSKLGTERKSLNRKWRNKEGGSEEKRRKAITGENQRRMNERQSAKKAA